jgi:thiol:disulfide interchange protein
LLLGTAVSRRGRREPAKTPAKKASWWEPMLARGAALAFVVGIVLNIIPGVLPFVALKDIADGGYTVAATVALVVGFYLVMFVLVEVPLALYVLAPARADAAVVGLNAWLDRNGRRAAAFALVGVGIYLIARGIIGLAA